MPNFANFANAAIAAIAAFAGTHAFALDATASAAVKAEEPVPGFRLPAGARPVEYTLHFAIDPAKEKYWGAATIKVHVDKPQRTLWLHGKDLDVGRVTVGKQQCAYKQRDDDGLAAVSCDAAFSGDVDVVFDFSAKYSDSLEGIYKVTSEGNPYVFTQFEAISARGAFPCFDEPGFKVPFTLSFEVPAASTVVSNTGEASRGAAKDGVVTVTFAKTRPLPVYLVAFAVGALDVVNGPTLPANALRKEPLPIRGIATKGHGKQMAKSLAVSAEALTSLEKYFGVAYPFGKMDIVAVPDFAAGAMENAGLVTFRDSLLFVDDKSPIGLQKGNAYVIAHEFAHQWFGDLVTLAWWDDIWLNEAFATWMESHVVQEIRPDFNAVTEARSGLDWVTGADSLVSARQIRQPVQTKGDIINAFDGITYDKGASVIAMFEAWMGADKFQQGVRAYMKDKADKTATAADLLAALSKSSGKDVATPFSTFLDQPGVPYVEAKLVCEGKSAHVDLAQSRYLPIGSTGDRKKQWQVPVCVRTDAKASTCTLLTQPTGSLALDACPKWVHPNEDGRGYYRWSLPGDQLKALSSSLKTLAPGERISLGNALRAGFSAGTVAYADALDAALPLANDQEPDVINTPLSMLSFAWSELVEPAARAKVQQKIVDVYKPVLDAVGLVPKDGEDPRVRERRTLAINALTNTAEDKATIEALAKMGRAALAKDKVHLEKVNGDLAGHAIFCAVKTGGAAAWDDAQKRLSTETDSLTRSYLLGALGNTQDPALTGKARDLALDPRLKVNEILNPLYGQAGDFRTRDAVWAWLPGTYDKLVARLPQESGGARVPGLFSGFCSEDKAKELDAFFTPKKAKTPGMERSLAIALESVRLCSAKRAVHMESARKVFPSR